MDRNGLAYRLVFLGLAAVAGCNEPTTFEDTSTDMFIYFVEDDYATAAALLQADYVLSMDYGYRMNAHAEELIETLDSFVSSLNSAGIDYRIGVVRGSAQSSSDIPSTFLGILDKFSSSSAYSSLENKLYCPSGSSYCIGDANSPHKVYMLEGVRRTLDSNTSFIRDSAQLVLAFFSNADDVSSSNAATYATGFKALKSNAAYVSGRAFVRGTTGSCASGDTTQGYKTGTKLKDVAVSLSGTSGNKCLGSASSMASMLDNLARNVTKSTQRFKIRGNPVASTVKVYVNGVLKAAGTDYDYNSGSQEIVFRSGKQPADSASLLISYKPIIQLKRRPNPNSIVVKVDGVTSSAWSYNSSQNRIEFSGSGAPDHNDKIEVSYEVQ